MLSLLFGLAAMLAEPALARWGLPRRMVWATALCASLAVPTVMSLSATSHAQGYAGRVAVVAMMPGVTVRGVAHDQRGLPPASALAGAKALRVVAVAQPWAHWSTPVWVVALVRIGWPSSCVVAWLFFAIGMGRLLIGTGRLPRIVVFGTTARLTDNMGPAVFGIWRPILLWPKWLQSASLAERRVALAHELEHLRCRDPLLLALFALLVSLAPWNGLLWWQFRRLRLAVE
ncbi:MAG TPA: M56 family metallopeptidase, partial [Polyangiales bacterium]|nr:M56 family metallopeptidase [Polyangiales bacterium]